MAIEDLGCLLKGVMWSQVVLAAIFIGMRSYTRHMILKNMGADDVLMIANLVTFVGFAACITVGVHYGISRGQAHYPRRTTYSKAIMWEAIGQAICTVGVAVSKSSVAVFLLRIVVSRWHKVMLWFCIATTTMWSVVATTLLFVQCRPTAYLWDWTIDGGYCWFNFTRVAISMGAWSTSMDFVFALLPWQIVYGLNMKRKDKLTVAIGLSLGIFSGICSSIRTHKLRALTSLSSDTVPALVWSATEVCTTVLCACTPLLRPLYLRVVRGADYARAASGGRMYSYPLTECRGKSRSRKGVSDGESMVYACAGMEEVGGEAEAGVRSTVSEESYLREDRVVMKKEEEEDAVSGIRRTDEVVVNVECGVEGIYWICLGIREVASIRMGVGSIFLNTQNERGYNSILGVRKFLFGFPLSTIQRDLRVFC
ncbi:hypothetical protein PMIN07_009666 [Paraphaeosphaeria minitans]